MEIILLSYKPQMIFSHYKMKQKTAFKIFSEKSSLFHVFSFLLKEASKIKRNKIITCLGNSKDAFIN